MKKDSKIWVAGRHGLVGSAIIRNLEKDGYTNIINHEKDYKFDSSRQYAYDLRDAEHVYELYKKYDPEYVFLAAAKVGGIGMNNNQSGEMIYNNLLIQTNVINLAHKCDVKKLMFLGSSCIYPKLCPQPIKEEYLLTGELEKTNIGYAVAKIAGLTMCEMYRKQYGSNFISAMPTNLYGYGDNFHLENSHVLPAMIRKFHEAKLANTKMVELWGSGTPKREFLFIDDLAEGLIYLMDNYDEEGIINVGTGEDVSIQELAEIIKKVVGYEGQIMWDASKPDGTPRKLLDVSKINNLGWKAKTSLEDGVKKTYTWFQKNYNDKNTRL